MLIFCVSIFVAKSVTVERSTMKEIIERFSVHANECNWAVLSNKFSEYMAGNCSRGKASQFGLFVLRPFSVQMARIGSKPYAPSGLPRCASLLLRCSF